jgi:solute carrier family 25 S-adenosylmethionine transporter 26
LQRRRQGAVFFSPPVVDPLSLAPLFLSIRQSTLAHQGSPPAPSLSSVLSFSPFPSPFPLSLSPDQKKNSPKLREPFRISPIVADALAGAAGEIAQLSSLYPLDTVKVVQQAADCSLGGALRLLAPAGAKPTAVLAAFYRGCLPACVASAAVGAVYLVSFSGAQRAWERAAVKGGRGGGGASRAAAAPAASAVAVASSSASASDSDEGAALEGSSPSVPFALPTVSAAAVEASEGRDYRSSTSSSTSSSTPSASSPPSHPQHVPAHVQAEAAAAGAVVASVATSLMEAPQELFRHRAQAVVVAGAGAAAAGGAGSAAAGAGVLAQASAAFAAGGVKELYRGLAPYVLKSAPYDISELLVYSMLRGRGGGNGNGGDGGGTGGESPSTSSGDGGGGGVFSLLPAAMRPPPQLAHAVLGAVAGAAAVVASMPADCIKLKLELSSAPVAHGVRESVAQFFWTGRRIAAGPGGASALFRGMGPRLAEKVPSTMIYWVVVEAARKALAPHVHRGGDEREAALAAVRPAKEQARRKQKRKSFFRRSSSSEPCAASSPCGDFVVA